MTMPDPSDHAVAVQSARDWIVRLSSGDMTEAELAELALWRGGPGHEAVFQHELQLWRSLGSLGNRLSPNEIEPIAALTAGGRRFRPGYAAIGIAACLALLLSAPAALLRFKADHRTDAEVASLTLPDGSRAVLDARSAIAVHFAGNERRIELLKGRAWFEVVHDRARPFRVEANGGLVEDVGTAFVVSTEPGQAETAVTSGIVQVRSETGEGRSMKLAAGQRAGWSEAGSPLRRKDVPVGRIAAWRDGDVLLDAAPVRTAIDEIARYRHGPTFVVGDFAALAPVTAIIRAHRADEGLDALAASASLRIIRLPGGIAIVRPQA